MINEVRKRAALPGKEKEMQITAVDLTMDFILDERGRELLGEMDRWFDLVRTGTLVDRVKKYNPDAAANIQPFHILRSIPSDQIDRPKVVLQIFGRIPVIRLKLLIRKALKLSKAVDTRQI